MADSNAFAAGVGFMVLGCLCAATGLLLMKSSTMHEGHKPIFMRWRWLLGFCFLGILTTAVDVYVLGILPLSVVAPFAGLTIVFTLALARTGLLVERELMSRQDVFGSALILLGVTLVSAFGPQWNHDPTVGEILESFCDPAFVTFACVSLLTVALWVALLLLNSPDASSCTSAYCSELMQMINRQLDVWPALDTALSAYTAAVCGALSQLFVKVVAVTLHMAQGDFLSPESPWRQTPPYLALAGLVVTAPLQLYLLDTALAGSAVSYAVPVYQALLIVLTTAAGGIFFHEFAAMPLRRLLVFALGVATATAGLAVLSEQPEAPPEDVGEMPSKEAAPVGPRLTVRESSVVTGVGTSVSLALLDACSQQRDLHTNRQHRRHSIDMGAFNLYGVSNSRAAAHAAHTVQASHSAGHPPQRSTESIRHARQQVQALPRRGPNMRSSSSLL